MCLSSRRVRVTGADHQSRHLLGSGSEGRIYSIASPLPPIANKKAPDSCESGAFIWCRSDESNTRPSHYEFSPAVQSELYRSSDERKSLSPLKFPHSAVEVVATQPPAKRAISVPELCHADRRAEPAKSRGPPVLPATRDKAQHSCFACFGAVERDYRLISPRQIFRPLAH